MNDSFHWIAVAILVTLATSRLIRLWTYDDFPPVTWLNDKTSDILNAVAPRYEKLTWCPWCAGFWVALFVIGLGFPLDVYAWTGWETLWWVISGALAASYVGAMIMARDGDTSADDADKSAV